MEYEFLAGQPVWVVYFTLFGIVLARTQATYWIGRGLGAGVHRSRWGLRLGARLERAERLINRFGPPVVTLAYLTVGVQTAVHLAAGAMRMRFGRYLAAAVVGSLLWAAVYTFAGLAVIATWWRVFLHSPPLAGAVLVLVAVAVAALVIWRRRRRGAAEPPGEREPVAT